MGRAGILITLVFVLVGVAVFLFYIRHSVESEVLLPTVSYESENLFEQSISTPEITFAYPKDFALAVTEEQVSVTSYIPPCDTNFDYCLYFSGGTYEGTNFDSAGLRIKRRMDLVGTEACITTPPEGFAGVMPITQTQESYATSLFPNVGDAGAGHYATGELYRLFFQDTCYEFETRIGISQFSNYEPGAIEEFSEGDKATLARTLRSVLKGVMFTESKESVVFPQ